LVLNVYLWESKVTSFIAPYLRLSLYLVHLLLGLLTEYGAIEDLLEVVLTELTLADVDLCGYAQEQEQ
jgi:hypothetical protein